MTSKHRLIFKTDLC